jgi:simple sugar transport system ATP-binding protein
VLRGLALVPEERRKEGIFIEEPIGMNLAVSADNSFSRWSLFGHRQAWRWAEEVIARGFVPPVRADPAPSFRRQPAESGDRQMAARQRQRLIFDEPTKGVDVKAKPICSP